VVQDGRLGEAGRRCDIARANGAIGREQSHDGQPCRPLAERRRVARLAAEVARCCRVSFVGRLIAALHGPAITATGAIR
jgi:hypothetical protein